MISLNEFLIKKHNTNKLFVLPFTLKNVEVSAKDKDVEDAWNKVTDKNKESFIDTINNILSDFDISSVKNINIDVVRWQTMSGLRDNIKLSFIGASKDFEIWAEYKSHNNDLLIPDYEFKCKVANENGQIKGSKEIKAALQNIFKQ